VIVRPSFQGFVSRPGGAGGGPVLEASDLFTDTDGVNATAHTMNLGGPWLQPSYGNVGQAFIASNRLTKDSNAAQAILYATTAPGANQQIKCRLRMLSAISVNAGLVARLNPASDNYYMLRHNKDTAEFQLRKSVGGVGSSLGTFSDTLIADDERDIELWCIGDQISAYVATVLQIGPITDTSHASGSAGIRFAGAASGTTGYAIDNWEAWTA
jgi:hypothetical protein